MADWTPADLDVVPNFWFDADDPATLNLNGGAVVSWTSRGQLPIVIPARNAGSQPAYTTVGTSGKPVVRGNGTTSCMLLDPGPVGSQWNGANGQSANVFAVLQYRAGAVWFKWENWPNRWSPENADRWDYATGNDRWTGIPYPQATPCQLHWDTTGGIKRVWADGNLLNGQAAIPTPGQDVAGYISLFASSDGNYGADLDLAEWLVLPYIPTLDEKQKIEGYLAHKWNINARLPVDHPYKDAPPSLGGQEHYGELTDASASGQGLDAVRVRRGTFTDPSTAGQTFDEPDHIVTGALNDGSTTGQSVAGARTRFGAVDSPSTTGAALEGSVGLPGGQLDDASTSGEEFTPRVVYRGTLTSAAQSGQDLVPQALKALTSASTSGQDLVGGRIRFGAVTNSSLSGFVGAGSIDKRGALTSAAVSGEEMTGRIGWRPIDPTTEIWTDVPQTDEVWTPAIPGATPWQTVSRQISS